MKKQITQSRLKELMNYNPHTGVFTRLKKVCGSNGLKVGEQKDNGYARVKIDGKSYRLHRLAFLYMTGDVPEIVDHKNRVRSDNRWNNLRSATSSINARNTLINKNNKTGVNGVHWQKKNKKWVVQIAGNGNRYKGSYNTKDEAEEVRREHEQTLGYENE